MGDGTAGRWLRIARRLRDELPGEWTLRGPADDVRLVREPVEWLVQWVGYGPRSPESGRLYAGTLPLLEPFEGWHLQYGTVMDDVIGGPKILEPAAPGALDVARGFVLGHALEKLDLSRQI